MAGIILGQGRTVVVVSSIISFCDGFGQGVVETGIKKYYMFLWQGKEWQLLVL